MSLSVKPDTMGTALNPEMSESFTQKHSVVHYKKKKVRDKGIFSRGINSRVAMDTDTLYFAERRGVVGWRVQS